MEHRTSEEGLREREAGFHDLADSAPVMIGTRDEGGKVTFVNRGWLAFTGTKLEEELGESRALGVHPDDSPEVLTSWTGALEAGEPWEHEYRLRRNDGEYL